MAAELLAVRGLHAGYGAVQVLHGVELHVGAGEVVALIGSNGAGKSTLMRCIAGLTECRGALEFEGRVLHPVPARQRGALGLVMVPEGRRLFRGLSVRDNLLMGAFARQQRGGARAAVAHDLERVLSYFPRLRERARQDASTLSGGEQQMCAIGRALMAAPRLLLVDELSLGLAPKVVDELAQTLRQINREGVAVLLVEQDVGTALDLSTRAYVMDQGRIVHGGPSEALRGDASVRAAYLGSA